MTDTAADQPCRAPWSAYVLLALLGLFVSPLTFVLPSPVGGGRWPVLLVAVVAFVLFGVQVGRRLPAVLPARFGAVAGAVSVGVGALCAVEGWLAASGRIVAGYGAVLMIGAAVVTQRWRAVRCGSRAPPRVAGPR